MIRPVFHTTYPERSTEDFSRLFLLLEVTETSFSYAILDEENKLVAAAYYVYPSGEGRNVTDAIREIIYGQETLQKDFSEEIIVYNFSESTLIPDSVYKQEINREVVEVLFGNLRKGLVLSEKVGDSNIHTIYRIPASIHNLLQQKFTAGKYWHIYSLWIQTIKELQPQEEEKMYIIFGSDKMIVSIVKKQELVLLRSFAYTSPEDVVYQLLYCCEQLSLSQEKCFVSISGYIDEDSALFSEIKKYFLRLEFDQAEVRPDQNDAEYPLHYFSYLQKMAICAL